VESGVREGEPFELDAGNADFLLLEKRMAYIVALEKALDEQAARHREEIERLTREIDRLRRS
jgi:hypothetical protein